MHALTEFVAFDLETTGLSAEADSVIEIGAVRVKDGVLGERFSVVVKPRTAVSFLSSQLTGISEAELAGGMEPSDALRAFLDFAKTSPLVAHHVEFDAHFIQAELKRAGIEYALGDFFDSLLMVRIAWPEWPNHKLETVAARLDLPQGKAHRALPDAEWAAMAWLKAEEALAANPELSRILDGLLAAAPAPWNRLGAQPVEGDAPKWSPRWAEPKPLAGRANASALPEGWWKTGGALHLSLEEVSKDAGPWPEKLLSEFHRALSEGRWCSLETSDPRSHAMALASAASQGMKSGRGVLIVVPDARAEEILLGPVQSAVRAALGQGWRLQILREPEGYVSPSRLEYLAGRLKNRFSPGEILGLLPILSWGYATVTGDLVAFPGASADKARPLGMKVTSVGYGPDEPYAHAAHARASDAEVVVIRQETFIRDLELDGSLIPPVDGVLFLEAHRMPEAMEAWSGKELSFFKIRHLLQTIGASSEDPQGLAGWLTALAEGATLPEDKLEKIRGLAEKSNQAEKQTQRWLAKIGRQAEKRVKHGESRLRFQERIAMEFSAPEGPVIDALQDLSRDLQDLAQALVSQPEGWPAATDAGELALLSAECTRAATRLNEAGTLVLRLSDPHPGEVAWVEDFQNPHKIRIRSRSMQAAEAFAGKLSELHRGGLWLSPTLSLGDGTQRQFARRSGLAFLEPSPRYVIENPAAGERLFLLTPFAPSHQGPDAVKPLAELLARSLAKMAVPTAIFAPSQSLVKSLREALLKSLPERRVITQGFDGNRDSQAFLFKQHVAPIFIGQDWPSQLRDAEGQPVRLMIVARIPFAPPSDPMIAARSEQVQQEGKHPLFEVLVPEAAFRIKDLAQRQRQPGLRQVAWLLDPRAARERYGNFLIRAIAGEARNSPDEADLVATSEAWLAAGIS